MMQVNQFRNLKADEIECRVGSVPKDGSGFSLLLYKDARCDMNILDETVGPLNWERKHEVINGVMFCTLSIWDKESNRWISKQDCGTKSKTDPEKGESSDSFKRAAFNFGIGRELYTSPFIWIPSSKGAKTNKFYVSRIGYNDKSEINKLTIINKTKQKVAFEFDCDKKETVEQVKQYSKNDTNESCNSNTNSNQSDGNVCSMCGTKIGPAIMNYCKENNIPPLCMKCQKNKNKE